MDLYNSTVMDGDWLSCFDIDSNHAGLVGIYVETNPFAYFMYYVDPGLNILMALSQKCYVISKVEIL